MRVSLLLAMTALAACNAPSEPANDAAPVEYDVSANVVEPVNDAAADASTNTAMPPFAEVPGAYPTAPEPAPIPARFRGTWADSKAACADLKHHSRLGISGRTVRFPDFVIFGDRVIAAGNQFEIKGRIEATGAPADAQYFINDAGDVLTDGGGGGAVRVRCG